MAKWMLGCGGAAVVALLAMGIAGAFLVDEAVDQAEENAVDTEQQEEQNEDQEAEEAVDEEEDLDAVAEELGYPPAPEGEQRELYIDAISQVDTGFVFPDEDTVIDRGRDLCVEAGDEGAEAALQRIQMIWAHADYPERETTAEDAQQLLDAVQAHICTP